MDLEKNEKADLAPGRESIESYNNLHDPDPNAETSIAKQKSRTTNDTTNNNNLAPIRPTRSRSSVRSSRSYAGADGYTHFEHDDQNNDD
jgi:hypothetical protein